mmetsp:Transcript_94258/g.218973  ORF Transcript_94258/g.218973 Transcript_94258/m.218973 type:complete len:565 (+) Transcript_94258:48-1742(+)
MQDLLLSSLTLLHLMHSFDAAKVYMCKWPRSVLSGDDPNLTVTVGGSEVRCDRTGDASHICEAACDYQKSDPYQCLGPVEDGDVCNTVWGSSSLSFYKLESVDSTQACMRRYNSDCSADMGGTFCWQLNQCHGSYQQVVLHKDTFVERYGYEPSFLQQPWEILEPPTCSGRTTEQCCMTQINYYRCLHGVPPVMYHRGIAASAQAWADLEDKPSIHSNWGSGFYPHYTELLTWGTWGCERGVGAWYKEIGVHNFSINAVQDAGGSYNSGHMVLLLWGNHTMVGCGAGNADNPIVVCDFAWAHQGHKGNEAWEANLHPRSGATQEECRASSIASLSFPVLVAGEDISGEQLAALQDGTLTGDGSGWIEGEESATTTVTTNSSSLTSTSSATFTARTTTATSTTQTTTTTGTSTTESTSSTTSATSAETTTGTVIATATTTATETPTSISHTTTATATSSSTVSSTQTSTLTRTSTGNSIGSETGTGTSAETTGSGTGTTTGTSTGTTPWSSTGTTVADAPMTSTSLTTTSSSFLAQPGRHMPSSARTLTASWRWTALVLATAVAW